MSNSIQLNRSLLAYSNKGHRKVEGWLEALAIVAITRLAELQLQLNIRGSICEIGVHHGRLFILLHLLSSADERSVAYDLFDRQEENIDQSGTGNYRAFIDNLSKHDCAINRIKVVSENSLRLTPARILADCESKPRLFSIDGGHTAEITAHDLRLGAHTICDGGLIILDDFYNEPWPAVAEGACRFLQSEDHNLVPVVIAGNKFIFTNNERYADEYIKMASSIEGHLEVKLSHVFGRDVVVLTKARGAPVLSKLARTRLWKSIRGTPLGAFVRRSLLRR